MTDRSSRAPREVLEALAEAADKWFVRGGSAGIPDVMSGALSVYRAAIAPLRSRAEVDAEIGAAIRQAMLVGFISIVDNAKRRVIISGLDANRFIDLCREPTTDSGPARGSDEDMRRRGKADFGFPDSGPDDG